MVNNEDQFQAEQEQKREAVIEDQPAVLVIPIVEERFDVIGLQIEPGYGADDTVMHIAAAVIFADQNDLVAQSGLRRGFPAGLPSLRSSDPPATHDLAGVKVVQHETLRLEKADKGLLPVLDEVV